MILRFTNARVKTPIAINLNRVISFEPWGDGTRFDYDSGSLLVVEESFEEVFQKINEDKHGSHIRE